MSKAVQELIEAAGRIEACSIYWEEHQRLRDALTKVKAEQAQPTAHVGPSLLKPAVMLEHAPVAYALLRNELTAARETERRLRSSLNDVLSERDTLLEAAQAGLATRGVREQELREALDRARETERLLRKDLADVQVSFDLSSTKEAWFALYWQGLVAMKLRATLDQASAQELAPVDMRERDALREAAEFAERCIRGMSDADSQTRLAGENLRTVLDQAPAPASTDNRAANRTRTFRGLEGEE